jgi:hypothetical protein
MPRFTEEELAKLLNDNPDLKIAQPVVAVTRSRAEAARQAHNLEVGSSNLSSATNEPEKDFQKWLIRELRAAGWTVCEFRKARVLKGGHDVYRTPFGADGVGFPDLVAVRAPRVLFIENKSNQGTASPEQVNWLMLLAKCPGVEVKCWSPKDREEILKTIE